MRQCIYEFLITKGKIWCGSQFVELIKRFRMAPLSPSWDFSKVNAPNVDQKSGPEDISTSKSDQDILKTAIARKNKT